jgi:phosphatidylserine/phosphatidylglycerophosphate/cardiolipin synthase-like enzyme
MSEEVAGLAQTIATASELAVADGAVPTIVETELLQKAEQAKARLRAMTQRELRCHEHPRLLTAALTKSKSRLLIVSPWVNHHVVDDIFVRSLEALLRNGVDVYIGYGIGENEDAKGNDKVRGNVPITPQVEKEFDDLQKRFDNLTVKFVGNTHRKQLVSDDNFAVITSFNWLSFKGDQRKKARDEFGILISEPTLLESVFQDGLRLISEGYDHPPAGHNRVARQANVRGAQ